MGSGALVLIAGFLFATAVPAQERALQEAARLDGEHKCDEAEQFYRQALAAGPSSPAVLNNLGNHYLTCGAPQKAGEVFERLLKINPAHVNANLQMARMALSHKDAARALDYIAGLPGKASLEDPEVILVRAEALQQVGKQQAAAALIDRLTTAAGNNPQLLFAIGIACGRMGLYPRAESAFTAVLAQDPGDFDVVYNLGLAATRGGHDERARSAFESALKARPSDVSSLHELGQVESKLGNYTRAVYLLAQARKLAPERPDVLLSLARASQMGGFYGDSILAYNDYLKLRPADDLVRRDLALIRGYSRDGLEQGRKELEDYVAKHPTDAVGFYNLAQLDERSDRTKALAHVTTAIHLSPDFEPAHFFRAWLLQKLEREPESIEELRITLRLNPRNARALDLMGLSYLNLDKPAEAEKVLRQAAALSPEEPDVLFHLSRALMELGRSDEARSFQTRFEKVRQQGTRGPREEPGVIESVGLPPSERAARVIEQLRQLVDNSPEELSLRINLGSALLTQGSVTESLSAFRQLLALNPASAISHEAGTALLRFEQYGLARDFLQRAVVDRPSARMDLAIAVFFAEGPSEALSILNKIPDGEDRGDYLLLKAKILDAAGHAAEADAAIDESMRTSVSRPRLAEEASLLLVAHQQKAKALELITKAVASAPGDPGLLLARVAVLSAMGRNQEAEAAVHKVERRWPEWDSSYLMEGLLLERNSQFERARQRIEIARTLGSRNPAATCALARMANRGQDNSSDPKCSCQPGPYASFFPPCVPDLR